MMKLLLIVVLLECGVLSVQQGETTTDQTDGGAGVTENGDVPVSDETTIEDTSTSTQATFTTDYVGTSIENVNHIRDDTTTAFIVAATTTPESVYTTTAENVYSTTPENVYTTTSENVYSTTSDKFNITMSENDNTTMSQNDNTTMSQNDNTTMSQNDNTTTSQNDNTTMSQNDNTTTSQNDNTTTSQNDNTTMSQNDNTTTSQNDNTTTSEKDNTTTPTTTESSFVADNTSFDHANTSEADTTPIYDFDNTTSAPAITSEIATTAASNETITTSTSPTPTTTVPTKVNPKGVSSDCLNRYKSCTEKFRTSRNTYCADLRKAEPCIKEYSNTSENCTDEELFRIDQLDCGPAIIFNNTIMISNICISRMTECLSDNKGAAKINDTYTVKQLICDYMNTTLECVQRNGPVCNNHEVKTAYTIAGCFSSARTIASSLSVISFFLIVQKMLWKL